MPDGVAIWWITPGDEDHPEFHQATLAWVRSLGLDPERLGPTAAVVPWDGAYELHVDEIPRGEHGDRFDPFNHDALLKIRRIIPVAENSWPPMAERVPA